MNKATQNILFILVLVIIIILIWASSGYLMYKWIDSPVERGTFGDMFGVINSLFSGLALGGIILTLILQQNELKNQRIEIKRSTDELTGQKDAMIQQNFENNFFRLLNIHRDNIESHKRADKSGFQLFGAIQTLLIYVYNKIGEIDDHFSENEKIDISTIISIYGLLTSIDYTRELLHKKYPEEIINKIILSCLELKFEDGVYKGKTKFGGKVGFIDHYFEHLYQVIKYVSDYRYITDEQKKPYIDIIKAQLSAQEQFVLFFYSLSMLGKDWQRSDYILKYALVNRFNVRNRIILNPLNFYDIEYEN